MNASEFKAKCLAILDEVARTGEAVVILKRGKPVARVVREDTRSALDDLMGSVTIVGDIIAPVVEPESWDAVRGEL